MDATLSTTPTATTNGSNGDEQKRSISPDALTPTSTMGSEQQNANGNGGEEGHDDETGFASKFRFLRSKKQAAEQQKQQQELSDAENDKEEEEKVEPEQVKDQEEEPKNTDNDEKRTRTHSTTPSSLKNGSHQKPPAHRRYNAIQPVANKYLAKRWDESNQKNHLARLATSKPTIDTKAPKAYLHMQLNLKKLQVEEGGWLLRFY